MGIWKIKLCAFAEYARVKEKYLKFKYFEKNFEIKPKTNNKELRWVILANPVEIEQSFANVPLIAYYSFILMWFWFHEHL
jgi:hypothetical protein